MNEKDIELLADQIMTDEEHYRGCREERARWRRKLVNRLIEFIERDRDETLNRGLQFYLG